MHYTKLLQNKGIIAALLLLCAPMLAVAGDFEAKHKLVIQVSTDDARTQKIALNNAVNVQKLYGMDNVDVEIVAYGPGLGLLTAKSKEAGRVKSLAQQNITFSACGNTMKKVEKKTGKAPKLTEGVKVVNAGVVRIMELQSQGYAYIRP
ncbi:MAG: DsrE family protein [Gammaproteobacteria bacterium]|nr:DsrE family protein [Gammaproteobacteria bacterium]MDH5801132.1 DsrE family protein [Gammaproteobacteria bacterium]